MGKVDYVSDEAIVFYVYSRIVGFVTQAWAHVMTDTVWGFFYGGLINPAVMKRVGMAPRQQMVATLPGFDLSIAPLVNLNPNRDQMVYGLLMELTHAELQHVYGQLKATYLPFPVIAYELSGLMRPALCYIVPHMASGRAEADHVEALLTAAEALAFPDWYLQKIKSFHPSRPA